MKIKDRLKIPTSSSPHHKALTLVLKTGVLKPFAKELKKLIKDKATKKEARMALKKIIQKSSIKSKATAILLKYNAFNLKSSSTEFLTNLQKIKKGIKPKSTNILIKKEALKDYSFVDSKKRLDMALAKSLKGLNKGFAKLSPAIEKDITGSLGAALDRIINKKKIVGFDVILKQYNNLFLKKITRVTGRMLFNNKLSGLNNGDEQGAKASKVVMLKVWRSRFDAKTRNWHDRVNLKVIKLKDKFRVAHPKGLDFITAPKVGAMSGANFANCRCWCDYKSKKGFK